MTMVSYRDNNVPGKDRRLRFTCTGIRTRSASAKMASSITLPNNANVAAVRYPRSSAPVRARCRSFVIGLVWFPDRNSRWDG